MEQRELRSIVLKGDDGSKGATVVLSKNYKGKKNEAPLKNQTTYANKFKPHVDMTKALNAFIEFVPAFLDGAFEGETDGHGDGTVSVDGVKLKVSPYDNSTSVSLVCSKQLVDGRVFNFVTPQLSIEKVTGKQGERLQAAIETLEAECIEYVVKKKREFVQLELPIEEGEDDGEGEEGEQVGAAA